MRASVVYCMAWLQNLSSLSGSLVHLLKLNRNNLKASLLYKCNCILGEGPYWHHRRNSFFWVDIEGQRVHEMNWSTRETNQWQLTYRPSLVIEGNETRMLLALQGGFASLDLATGKLEWVADLEKHIPDNRTNDGACDSRGRLWIGTMQLQCEKGRGALYCLDEKLNIQKKLDNLTISNGIVWTRDNQKMYHIDTSDGVVRGYTFNEESGEIKLDKIAIKVPKEMGSPDGMCMDEEEMLWIAHWGGAGVYRWNPNNGQLLDKIELPVPLVTSCAFGGQSMDELLITTARDGMTRDELRRHPESGNVFVAKPGVKGMLRNKFSGIP